MSKIHSISFRFGKIGNSKAYSIGGSKVVSLKCLRYWFYFKSDKCEKENQIFTQQTQKRQKLAMLTWTAFYFKWYKI